MRIFYNPRDRKELENNEQAVAKPTVTSIETKMEVQHDGVESEPAGSNEPSEGEQAKEVQTTTKKAWKKKTDSTV